MERLVSISKKLSDSSVKNFNNPYTSIEWPESLDPIQWHFTPELISCFDTEIYRSMSEDQKKKLSFYEAVNFFSLNIHGEKDLIAGLADHLYGSYNSDITDYIHHFIDEENKHMLWFGTFCEKYAGKVYPETKMSFPREYAPGEQEFLFFAKVVVFEELVDYYNVVMGKDKNLQPIVQQIHRQHHHDESRHLAFGREMAASLFEKHCKESWDDEVIENIRQYLSHYIVTTWREYYNPAVYIDADVENAFDVVESAWEAGSQHRNKVGQKVLTFLKKNKMIPSEFSL